MCVFPRLALETMNLLGVYTDPRDGGWEQASSVVDLNQASGECRTALLWASLASQSYVQKALSHWASRLHGGVVPWQTLMDSQPSSERPSPGRQPRSRTKREGGRALVWEDCRVGSAWSCGAGPTASSAARHPQQGLCSGWAMQEQQAGLAWPRRASMPEVFSASSWSSAAQQGSSATDVVSEGEARNPSLSPFATSMAFLNAVGQLPLLISSQN